MKKLILLITVIFWTSSVCLAQSIDSVEKLKSFMVEGQKSGYFPKTIPLYNPVGTQQKLEEIDLDFRKLIKWNINTRCPTTEDEIILATGDESHSIICNRGNTAVLLGSGNDEVDDATGNDIYYPGEGDDTLDTGAGNDIIIFDKNWGHDRLILKTKEVDTSRILGYDGSYPWKYNTFIIFTKEVDRRNIVWRGNVLYNIKTGDSIALQTKKVNILFASHPNDTHYTVPEQEVFTLDKIYAESVLKTGRYLFVAKGNEGMSILDVKDVENPVLLSQTVLPGRALSVAVNNDIAYVAQGDYYMEGKRGWVSIVDIHDKNHPKVLKHLKYGNTIKRVLLHNNTLYVPDIHFSKFNKRWLHIYDVSAAHTPQLLSTTKVKHSVSDMTYLNQKLYLIRSFKSMSIFDVSDLTAPKAVKNTPMLHQYGYLRVKDNLLVRIQEKPVMQLYHLQSDNTFKHLCDIHTLPKKPGENFFKHDSLIITDKLIYRAEGSQGISVSSTETCKRLNVIPSKTRLWENAIVLLDKHLLAYSTHDRSRIYPLADDGVHERKELKVIRAEKARKMSRDQLQTALHKAAVANSATEVKKLCALGANPNITGHEKTTPVEIAARLGRMSSLKALLENGGKATKKSMFLAALTEQDAAMRLLEKNGVPVTVRNRNGCTTLHYIAQDGKLGTVKYLIERGVPYDAKCRKGETPLTWANYGANCPVITYLETLYPASYQRKPNKKCEKEKLKAQIREINKRIEELNRKAGPLRTQKRKQVPLHFNTPSMNIKLKSKQKGEMLIVKCMVSHPMITENIAEKRGVDVNYIAHMTFKVGERIVYDMSSSPYLSKNPIVKFRVRNNSIKDKLTLIVKDNGTEIRSKSVKIRGEFVGDRFVQEKGDVVDFHKTHPEIWQAKSVEEAAKALYGEVLYQEGEIKLRLPKVAANMVSIPLSVISELEFESLAILSNTTEHPVIAVFSVPKGVNVHYDLKFKANKYENEYVLVIAKGRDGKYYKALMKFEIAIGGDNCS